MATDGKTKRGRIRGGTAPDGKRAEREPTRDSGPGAGGRKRQHVSMHAPGFAEQIPGEIPALAQASLPHGHAAGSVQAPERIRRRRAAQAIRALARELHLLDGDSGSLLAGLAALVEEGRRSGSRLSACETGITHCLDEALLTPQSPRAWLLCQGAAWAVAWLARSTRTGGSGGAQFERLVAEARGAQGLLRTGDTSSAAFVATLCGLFFTIDACRQLRPDLAAALGNEIARQAGSEAHLPPETAAAAVARVERWTAIRAASLASHAGLPWDDAAESGWEDACEQALRLLGSRGRLPGPGGEAGSPPAALVKALVDARKGTVRRTVAALSRRPGDGAVVGRVLPRDSVSRQSSVAVLRSGWERGSLRVLFDFRGPRHLLEIAAGDRLIAAGEWEWAVEADGAPLTVAGDWSVSCFETDRTATFLEIVAPLWDGTTASGLQIERQIVLLPKDRVLLLTDSITTAGLPTPAGQRPERLLYRGSVPLVGSGAAAEAETRELRIPAGRGQWRVLPLALAEWRTAPAVGCARAEAAGIVLEQEAAGGRLSAPLWFDCDPRRTTRPLTWRQLTVADNRRNLQRHEAVGFRVQAGLEQWLLYRALDTPRNRTLLGCNLSCEFLVGRIGRRGEVSRTLEIE